MVGLLKQAVNIFQFQRRAVAPVLHVPAHPELADGKARHFRDSVTLAPWLVSFNKDSGIYYCQPVGNIRLIRQPYACHTLDPRLVPSGTGLH
jgi:hypothetical protein